MCNEDSHKDERLRFSDQRIMEKTPGVRCVYMLPAKYEIQAFYVQCLHVFA